MNCFLKIAVKSVLACFWLLGCRNEDGNSDALNAKKNNPTASNYITVVGSPSTGKSWIKYFAENIDQIPNVDQYLPPNGVPSSSKDAEKFCPLFAGDKIYVSEKPLGKTQGDQVFMTFLRIERVSKAPLATGGGALNSAAVGPFDCSVLNGWVYVPHLNKDDYKKFALGIEDYDAILGARLAQNASHAAQLSSISKCYLYVGKALEPVWPKGFFDDRFDCATSTGLNCKEYAKNFAKKWKSSVHRKKIKLAPVYLSQNENGESVDTGIRAESAPVGSVLVWNSCSNNPAGHISIVTVKGEFATADFKHPISMCSKKELIGIFIPVANLK